MIEGISQMAQRLCACGLLSALALALTRDSGQQAILRLCCASLTIIVVFTSLPSLRIDQRQGQSFRRQMEDQARQALEQSAEAQRQAACQGVEQYLEGQARLLGLECRVSAQARLDPDNVFQLEWVEYYSEQPVSHSQRQGLLEAAGQLGLNTEQVRIEEGGRQSEE